MPMFSCPRDWRAITLARRAYHKKLLDKGLTEGSTKMMQLMARQKF